MIEEETLEQKHSCEVKTDWSDDAHKCDREGDSEVKDALVIQIHGMASKALNFGAIFAKVFFPFRTPTSGTDTRAVCMELLSKGKGPRLGVDVAKQGEVAVLVLYCE